MSRRFVGRRVRLALSTTDLLLLLVLMILMHARLLTAIAGSLVSLLFTVQHGIGAILLHGASTGEAGVIATARRVCLTQSSRV